MIEFGVWAPSEAAFFDSWIAAGICDAERRLSPPYDTCVATTAGTWQGVVARDGEPVAGWHCNVRVWGAVEASFTSGIEQYDEHGNLRDALERTWAADAFSLTEQPADPATGFPAGWRSPSGVVYTDSRNFTSPACVWQ